jgi:hypothetical protein
MMPRRSWSCRGIDVCIISIPQQARPKLTGQIDPCLAQFTSRSIVVLQKSGRRIAFHNPSLDAELTEHIPQR